MTARDDGDMRYGYARARRRIDWRAATAALALQALFVAALLSLGIVAHQEKRERLTVLSLQQRSETESAPAKPQPARAPAKPVVTPQPRTEVLAPPPKVDIAPAPPPIQAAAAPADPVPPAAPAIDPGPPAPSGPAGPVKVANLASNLLSGTPPAYPKSSRSKREEGTVVLRVVVGADGRVTEASISSSSGHAALDEAALAAVRKWRWSPTIREGRAVAITGLVRIPFALRT